MGEYSIIQFRYLWHTCSAFTILFWIKKLFEYCFMQKNSYIEGPQVNLPITLKAKNFTSSSYKVFKFSFDENIQLGAMCEHIELR